MGERDLTFLCHKFRLFLAVKIFSKALFYHRLRVFLAVSFWNKKSHDKGCVCKINQSNFKIAEYFVEPINLHTTAF